MKAKTVLAGLIGEGIQASLTPLLHETEGRALGLRYSYQLLDLKNIPSGVNVLGRLLDAAQLLGFAGLNITHPCKQAVIPYLNELSSEATAIGAVNTVVFSQGKRIGHNTDWWGFAEGFKRGLPDVKRDNVILLGAGGAGAALAYAAFQCGVKHLTVYDLNSEKAAQLVSQCTRNILRGFASVTADLKQVLAEVDGVMQATPIGMHNHPGTPINVVWLRPEVWVSEVIYTPLETELLRQAKNKGCQVLPGKGMTVFQAVRAFKLFSGLDPDPERMWKTFDSLANQT